MFQTDYVNKQINRLILITNVCKFEVFFIDILWITLCYLRFTASENNDKVFYFDGIADVDQV